MNLGIYYQLLKYLDDLILPIEFNKNQLRNFKIKAKNYLVQNGLLYKQNAKNSQRPLRVIKPSEVKQILYNFHEDSLAGHFGFNETYRAIS